MQERKAGLAGVDYINQARSTASEFDVAGAGVE
jgi:hypothetical protein